VRKQQAVEEEIEEQQGPNWTLLIVGYFALLAVVVVLVRPLHLTMGGMFFSMLVAGLAFALVLFLVKQALGKVASMQMSAKDAYHLAIGYNRYALDEGEDEDENTQPEVPAAILAERDPLFLGERFQPSFHAFLCATCLIVGIRRSGKSTLLLTLMGALARYGLPFVLLDTQGEYSGLVDRQFLMRPRLAGNVERMGEIPDAAKGLVANLTTENAYACGKMAVKHLMQLVVNLKGYDDQTAALIMSEIVDGVNDWQEERSNRERIPFTFALDEAQKWFPQDKSDRSPDIEAATQAVLEDAFAGTIVARGGKNGLGLIVATQRYSQLNKKLLQSAWKFYLRQSEEIDLARYKRQGIDPEEAKALQTGECIAYGPEIEHVRFQVKRSAIPHEGHTPGADALARYTRQLTFDHLQKAGAFLDDMRLEVGDAQGRPGLPERWKHGQMSGQSGTPGAARERPQDEEDEPVDGAGIDPDAFQAQKDDLLLSDLQANLVEVYYRDCGNVRKSLEQLGLGSRYQRHARFILAGRGALKKKAEEK
jgi:hypothetical protein